MYKRKRLSAEEYIKGILEGDRFKLGRAITLVESNLPDDLEIAEQVIAGIIEHTGKSIRVGITGVPGVGKSTFIETFGERLVSNGKKVAVLAVDPSSPDTQGSIMADKTRMNVLSRNENAFIRPTPAGSSLGGVARKTRETMLLCEAAGFDYIIVETVGIGQSEVAVKQMTDFFLLLMLAGAGDELQGIKKGVMEMADMVAITKADGNNIHPSKLAKAEYSAALHLYRIKKSKWKPAVVTCSALDGTNVDIIENEIEAFIRLVTNSGWLNHNRLKQNKHWMEESIREAMIQRFYNAKSVKSKLSEITMLVEEGKISPYKASRILIESYEKEKAT